MRKILFLCSMFLLTVGTASAQEDKNIFEHLGVSVGVGSTGVTFDLSTHVTDYVGIRAGVDYMPEFKYKTHIKIPGVAERQTEYNQIISQFPELPATNFPEKVDIEGKLTNFTGHILFDLYASKKCDWHLTLGAYFGQQNVANIYTTDDSQLAGAAEFNQIITNNPTDYPNFQKIGVALGDFFLEPDADGHVAAQVKVHRVRPYIGIGYGRSVPKNHRLGIQADLGVYFWGTPKVYCQGKELKKEDVGNSDGGFMKTLTKIKGYPALTVRLVGKIL